MTIDDSELFHGELQYERRIVIFFDTLGWRNQIQLAGDDPRKIARLASVPRMFCKRVTDMAGRSEGVHISSFSDNVVVSVPCDQYSVLPLLEALATIQLGLAMHGFWVRGAVTIGDLYHDAEIVFGPALNQAYELESREAIYSRAILDPDVAELNTLQAAFLRNEQGIIFTDPFDRKFIEHVIATGKCNETMVTAYHALTGLRDSKPQQPINATSLQLKLLIRASYGLKTARKRDVWEKHAWLFDRLAERLEVPRRAIDVSPCPKTPRGLFKIKFNQTI